MAIGTLFTLLVVPVIYLLIGRDHYAAAQRKAALEGEAAPAH